MAAGLLLAALAAGLWLALRSPTSPEVLLSTGLSGWLGVPVRLEGVHLGRRLRADRIAVDPGETRPPRVLLLEAEADPARLGEGAVPAIRAAEARLEAPPLPSLRLLAVELRPGPEPDTSLWAAELPGGGRLEAQVVGGLESPREVRLDLFELPVAESPALSPWLSSVSSRSPGLDPWEGIANVELVAEAELGRWTRLDAAFSLRRGRLSLGRFRLEGLVSGSARWEAAAPAAAPVRFEVDARDARLRASPGFRKEAGEPAWLDGTLRREPGGGLALEAVRLRTPRTAPGPQGSRHRTK